MDQFTQFNNARLKIEKLFIGLPHTPRLLIQVLISLASPVTGIVSGIGYEELGALLTISKASGRKDSGTPSYDAIRSFLRTIERACSNDFEVIKRGRNLEFRFPNLPDIYNEVLFQGLSVKELENLNEENHPKTLSANDPMEKVAGKVSEKSRTFGNNEYITNKTNKQTNQTIESLSHQNKTISSDFYPSEETITTALSRGFQLATCERELQKFIQYNQNKQTCWADYNPIFLQWLERHHEYETKQNANYKLKNRSASNERCRNPQLTPQKPRNHEELMAFVAKEHDFSGSREWAEIEGEFPVEAPQREAHSVVVDADDSDLWDAVYQQTGQHGQQQHLVEHTRGFNASCVKEWHSTVNESVCGQTICGIPPQLPAVSFSVPGFLRGTEITESRGGVARSQTSLPYPAKTLESYGRALHSNTFRRVFF